MSEMMIEGIALMVTGMVIVFGFLALLVLAVNLQTWLVKRYFPVKPTAPRVTTVSAAANELSIIAAITTSVTQYRNKYQK